MTSLSCTGFGLLGGAIGLRIRDSIILINLIDAARLVYGLIRYFETEGRRRATLETA